MITKEQKHWLEHLADNNTVNVVPFDPSSKAKFEAVKTKIQKALGEIEVVHKGATSLGISGLGELDIYIPVKSADFEVLIESLTQILGKPRSVYPLKRARFVAYVDGTKAEIFLINKDSRGWLDCLKFESHLKANQKLLEDYRKLKKGASGLSTQAYYRRKIEFINDVLTRI